MSLTRAGALGIACMICANGLTAAVDALAKHLSSNLHSVQIAWGYFASIAFVYVCQLLLRRRVSREILVTRYFALQLMRALALALTITTLFIAIGTMALTDAIAISFLAPLFVVLLAGLFLKERITFARALAVCVGFCGALIIIRPVFDMPTLFVLAPILSALFWAVFQTLTRQLALTDSRMTTLFYTAFGGLAWLSVAVGWFWVPLSLSDCGLLLLSGVLGLIAHLLMIRAFELAEASMLAPFNYVKLVWVALIAAVAFGEHITMSTMVGSIVIVAGGVGAMQATKNRT